MPVIFLLHLLAFQRNGLDDSQFGPHGLGRGSLDEEILANDGDVSLLLWFSAYGEAFEPMGEVKILTVPRAINAKYWQGNLPGDFMRWDQSIPADQIDGEFDSTRLKAFSEGSNPLILGDSTSSAVDYYVSANVTSGNAKPSIRYDSSEAVWQLSHDGASFDTIITTAAMDTALDAALGAELTAVDYDWTGLHSHTAILENQDDALVNFNLGLGNDGNADTVAAITVNVASQNTGDEDHIHALRITAMTNPGSSVIESAIKINESNWDAFMELEGTSSDDFETYLKSQNATADRLIYFPDATGVLQLSGTDVVPGSASGNDLGSSSLEWKRLYVGDNDGVNFGADQDAQLAYDESGDDRVELTGTNASLYVEDKIINGTEAITIPSEGTGAVATYTLNASASIVIFVCSDTDGCLVTLGESGTQSGQQLRLANAGTNNIAVLDTAGVSELTGAFNGGAMDTLTLFYLVDRWVEFGRSNN